MPDTTYLGLTYIEVGQSSKEVTLNEALDEFDSFAGESPYIVPLMAGETPLATGLQDFEFWVPPDTEGNTITYTIRRVWARTGDHGSTDSVLNVAKGTGQGGPTWNDILTSNLTITSGTGDRESESTGLSITSVQSGDKLRVRVVTIGTGSARWHCSVVLQRVF